MKAIIESKTFQRFPLHGEWGDAFNGAGWFRMKHGQALTVIFSTGMGWDHVSVSRRDRCPTWEEMCEVKDFFFNPDDVVVQYHPRAADYRNLHPHCLHMWRWLDGEFPTPDPIMVAPAAGELR